MKELGSVMKTMGLAPSEDTIEVTLPCRNYPITIELQKMIKVADTDGSGVIEFQEFMEMICDQMEVLSMFVLISTENIILTAAR